ncbi:MAG: hypothetical protein ACTHJ8_03585, partial [Mucilaginibacter sp.]
MKYILLFLLIITASAAFAQYPQQNYPGRQQNAPTFGHDTTKSTTPLTGDQEIDQERQKEEKKRDTVVFNSKLIKVNNEKLLVDRTKVLP